MSRRKGIDDLELLIIIYVNSLSVETSPTRSIGTSADNPYLHKC